MPPEHGLISIGEAAEILGVSISTLRRWDEEGKLVAHKSIGGQRRYLRSDLDSTAGGRLFSTAFRWVSRTPPPQIPEEYYCQTRDVFEMRLQLFNRLLEKSSLPQDVSSLLASAAGEVGNNSFDHNLGNWPDAMGVYFGYDLKRGEVVLADRGQGILASLQRIQPSLTQHTEALKMAFTEVITSRAPEKRGNGLKFVRKAIGKGAASISFQTGSAKLTMASGADRFNIEAVDNSIRGTIVSFKFDVTKKPL